MNCDRNQTTLTYSKKKKPRCKTAKESQEEGITPKETNQDGSKSKRIKRNNLVVSGSLNSTEESTSITTTNKASNDKRKRSKKSHAVSEEETYKKIDSYCMKRERSTKDTNVVDSSLLINLSYNNNQLQMIPKTKENSKCGSEDEINKKQNEMQVEGEQNINVVTIQGSFNNFNLGMEEEEEIKIAVDNYSLLAIIKNYISDYTLKEIDEKYNFDKFLQESDDNLLSNRFNNYFENQAYIDQRMRLILLDWIMEVCGQLSFKRATYHSAVVLIDVFLSKMENIQTNLLQLTGEIVIPTFAAFSHSTDYAYKIEEILTYEKYVLGILKWKINYPNLAFWSNYVTIKWDEFSHDFNSKYAFDLGFNHTQGLQLPKFRSNTTEEYFLFRNFFQLVDVVSLDYESLQYSEKILAAAIIYLLLGLFLKFFDIGQITKEFVHDHSIYAHFHDLNIIFNRFLINFLNIEFDDVTNYIVYVSFFFHLRFDYSAPLVHNDEERGVSHEEILQIQTHNPYNIASVEQIIYFRNPVIGENTM